MRKKKEEYYGIFKEKSEKMALVLLWIGIIAGILLRAVLILSRINYLWANFAWYSSMCLLIYFYSYRVYIENKRQKLIVQHNLREKLGKGKLSKKDMQQLSTIVDSVAISKVKWNHLFFLLMSIIFLIIQIIVDITKII